MIVPQIYRAIIDDVIGNVQPDFEEYGMDEDLLAMLQSKWEAKLLETRVAEFARAPPGADDAHHPARAPPPPQQPQPGPSAPYSYALPGMPSNGAHALGAAGAGPGAYGYTGYDEPRVKAEPEDVLRLRGGSSRDGKAVPPSPLHSVTSLHSVSSAPAPRPEPNAAGLLPGDDIIDSDLDDSDDELADDDDADADADGEIDIVFCVYDKVQRVKNKWKTVFKDGMIHVNGRDYLFAKCTGEFEW